MERSNVSMLGKLYVHNWAVEMEEKKAFHFLSGPVR